MADIKVKVRFTDKSKKSLKQSFVQQIVKERVAEYLKNNKKELYPINPKVKKQILSYYNELILPSIQSEQEIYLKEISGVYSPAFGYGNIDKKYKIKKDETAKNMINIYNAINKISAIIRNEDEVNYRIYIRVEDPVTNEVKYFSKQVAAEDIVTTYKLEKDNLVGDASQVLNKIFPNLNQDLNENEVQEKFYQHLNKFIKIIENKVPDMNYGFAYEAFEWHLNYYKENPTYGEDGLITSFKEGHERFYSPGVVRGYYKSVGNAKFSTGGDVYQTQLKSIQVQRQKKHRDQFSATSGFGVSSLGQLERTVSLIIQNLVKQDSLSAQNIEDLILAFNDLQREAAFSSYNKIIAVVDKRIEDALNQLVIL